MLLQKQNRHGAMLEEAEKLEGFVFWKDKKLLQDF